MNSEDKAGGASIALESFSPEEFNSLRTKAAPVQEPASLRPLQGV